jgi:hypothetical protein
VIPLVTIPAGAAGAGAVPVAVPADAAEHAAVPDAETQALASRPLLSYP